MAMTMWVLMFVMAGALLTVTLYAAVVGLAGAVTGARYVQCPRCHHHYLAGGADGSAHDCPHSIGEDAYQLAYSHLHHTHAA
jgi:hypothetical protein